LFSVRELLESVIIKRKKNCVWYYYKDIFLSQSHTHTRARARICTRTHTHKNDQYTTLNTIYMYKGNFKSVKIMQQFFFKIKL